MGRRTFNLQDAMYESYPSVIRLDAEQRWSFLDTPPSPALFNGVVAGLRDNTSSPTDTYLAARLLGARRSIAGQESA